MQKSFSIFFYEGHVGYSPSIINLAKILDNHEYPVTIYTNQYDGVQAGEMGGVKVISFPDKGLKKKLTRSRFQHLAKSIIFTFEILNRTIKNKFFKASEKCNINIGVDMYGLIVALIYFYIFGEKFLLLSLELYIPPRSLKKILQLACLKSEGVIIQDEDRFQTLCRHYGCQHPNVFFLPNSPLPVVNEDLNTCTENYFRKKFNLSLQEFPCIVLQAGAIADFVLSKVSATSFASLDNGCALILHSSSKKSEKDHYIQSLLQSNSKNLFLSLDPVLYDQIDKIYSATTIGIAFYGKNLGDNFSQISKASGKLGEYLKHGKPVLVNNVLCLVELVEKFNCGLVIQDPSNSKEIELAINQILDSYEWYSRNAKLCFDAEFDFAEKIKPILSFISSMSDEKGD